MIIFDLVLIYVTIGLLTVLLVYLIQARKNPHDLLLYPFTFSIILVIVILYPILWIQLLVDILKIGFMKIVLYNTRLANKNN